MAVMELNQDRVASFENKMLDTANLAALSLMLSIGHRTGLFDTMAKMVPGTSSDIAERCSLNERYVREWLGAMVTGGVVDYDADNRSYQLPSEHAAFLTRDAAPNNMASTMQYIAVLGDVEDQIVRCFREGGGVPYSEYTRFQTVMAEESAQTVIPALLSDILPLAEGLTDRLHAGIDVLDVGCGSGLVLVYLAQTYPKSRFVGYEISEEGIGRGRSEARRLGLKNVHFVLQDASAFGDSDAYDLVLTFDAVHDQANPAAMLRNIHRALKPGGIYLMQDIRASSHVHHNIEHPLGTLIYTISCMHCMTVSLSANGAGLGAAWGTETALSMLADAGFRDVRLEQLGHDLLNQFYVMTK